MECTVTKGHPATKRRGGWEERIGFTAASSEEAKVIALKKMRTLWDRLLRRPPTHLILILYQEPSNVVGWWKRKGGWEIAAFKSHQSVTS